MDRMNLIESHHQFNFLWKSIKFEINISSIWGWLLNSSMSVQWFPSDLASCVNCMWLDSFGNTWGWAILSCVQMRQLCHIKTSEWMKIVCCIHMIMMILSIIYRNTYIQIYIYEYKHKYRFVYAPIFMNLLPEVVFCR